MRLSIEIPLKYFSCLLLNIFEVELSTKFSTRTHHHGKWKIMKIICNVRVPRAWPGHFVHIMSKDVTVEGSTDCESHVVTLPSRLSHEIYCFRARASITSASITYFISKVSKWLFIMKSPSHHKYLRLIGDTLFISQKVFHIATISFMSLRQSSGYIVWKFLKDSILYSLILHLFF